MRRVLQNYIGGLYRPAIRNGVRLSVDGYAGARSLADWKSRVRAAWPEVHLQLVQAPAGRTEFEVPVRVRGWRPRLAHSLPRTSASSCC